jgi:hypothetical protein
MSHALLASLNPFMPRPTDPTPESRRMVQRMLEAIEAPKVKNKRRQPVRRPAMKKR